MGEESIVRLRPQELPEAKELQGGEILTIKIIAFERET